LSGRPPRYIPKEGALVETCTRTLHGLPFLRPDRDAAERILGVFGRALEYADIELSWINCMSNHLHALCRVENALQMADFQCYLNGNLARELGRHRGWHEKFWGRRYRPMIIDDDPRSQIARRPALTACSIAYSATNVLPAPVGAASSTLLPESIAAAASTWNGLSV
jgi:hypothetical protein